MPVLPKNIRWNIKGKKQVKVTNTSIKEKISKEKPQLKQNPKPVYKKSTIKVERRSIQTRKEVYKDVPVTIRKRYTQKVRGYQLHVVWIYRCKKPDGRCAPPDHYTELGYGPSIKHILKGNYYDGAGKKYTFKEMFAIAEHNAFTRESILCSPCYMKLHSINILKNVPVKPIQQNDKFNQKDKPAIQEFNFKLPVKKGLKEMKKIYGSSISDKDYSILHDIATGKLHIGEAQKRHERIFIKYGKIIHSIDEKEAQKRIKKSKENYRVSKKRRISKPLKIKEARKITERKPPSRKRISKKVKQALEGYENKEM
jgi:hypothetical protein